MLCSFGIINYDMKNFIAATLTSNQLQIFSQLEKIKIDLIRGGVLNRSLQNPIKNIIKSPT